MGFSPPHRTPASWHVAESSESEPLPRGKSRRRLLSGDSAADALHPQLLSVQLLEKPGELPHAQLDGAERSRGGWVERPRADHEMDSSTKNRTYKKHLK